MTTTAEETRSFVADALYNIHGRVYIALPNNRQLVPLMGERGDPFTPSADTEVLHIADPKTDEWVLRMVRALTDTNADRLNEQRSNRNLQNYVDRLGQAILEKAEEKDWCSEYDEFADEWDLPRRIRSYEVTVQFTVMARNSEEAEETVQDGLSWSFDMSWDPTVSAEEA